MSARVEICKIVTRACLEVNKHLYLFSVTLGRSLSRAPRLYFFLRFFSVRISAQQLVNKKLPERRRKVRRRRREMKIITIVKLGGRCITDKSTYETLDAVALEKCSSSVILSLSTARKSSSSTTTRGRNDQQPHGGENDEEEERRTTIVVHGAGSFGHMDAKRCGLGDENRRNMMNNKEFIDGCEKTRRSVQKLNASVAKSLEKNANKNDEADETVIVRAKHLGDAWRFNERGEVEVVGHASVREYCEENCRSALLLLHGDVVEDATHGRSILSGDRIAL